MPERRWYVMARRGSIIRGLYFESSHGSRDAARAKAQLLVTEPDRAMPAMHTIVLYRPHRTEDDPRTPAERESDRAGWVREGHER